MEHQRIVIAVVVVLIIAAAVYYYMYAAGGAGSPSGVAAASAPTYTFQKNTDYSLDSGHYTWPGFVDADGKRDVAAAKAFCDKTPECIGYNTHGWAKKQGIIEAGGKHSSDSISFYLKN